jgi:hypothetical protein
VGFGPISRPLAGYVGFIEYFDAELLEHEFRLRPRGGLPAVS